jgi:hypothetical protein
VPIVLLGAWLTGVVAEPIPDHGTPEIAADWPFTLHESGPGEAVLRFTNVSAGIATLIVTTPPGLDHALDYQARAEVRLADGTTRRDDLSGKVDPGTTDRHTLLLPEGTTSAKVTFTWDDGLIQFGDPLLVTLLDGAFDNDGYLTHPTFFAGWVGLLVTGINLLPASQLDGGHVARAVLGDRMRWAAYAAVAGLVYLALRFQSWMLMAVFILLMGVHHPPPLNDRTGLDVKRRVLAGVVLVVFLLTFVPRPIIL